MRIAAVLHLIGALFTIVQGNIEAPLMSYTEGLDNLMKVSQNHAEDRMGGFVMVTVCGADSYIPNSPLHCTITNTKGIKSTPSSWPQHGYVISVYSKERGHEQIAVVRDLSNTHMVNSIIEELIQEKGKATWPSKALQLANPPQFGCPSCRNGVCR